MPAPPATIPAVSLPARAWMAAARARSRLRDRRRLAPPREELVGRHAPGRSFLDVGCMWQIDGAIAFLAEEVGASPVTGLDLMPASAAFEAEHERRNSSMGFVQGDLHDPAVLERAGAHDVVWCSGVLYHAPHPVLTLERLRTVTRELLILGTEIIPEVPGLPQACVFYPGMDAGARAAFSLPGAGATRVGLDTAFDRCAGYGNWWWGLTPSAVRGLLTVAGFEPREERQAGSYLAVVAAPAKS